MYTKSSDREESANRDGGLILQPLQVVTGATGMGAGGVGAGVFNCDGGWYMRW